MENVYKKGIVEMLNKINDEKMLKRIYSLVQFLWEKV